mmetsp:Transcript_4290/g.7525  ORF Transcript_4290/g.7525 Transcript_4290/m.7525 type:complete len:113 (-) Transcript_4290:16-354(-)
MYSFPSTSNDLLPLTRSKTIGFPPTDLNARTGEFTPPGISDFAALKISSDFVVMSLDGETGEERVARMMRGDRLDLVGIWRVDPPISGTNALVYKSMLGQSITNPTANLFRK